MYRVYITFLHYAHTMITQNLMFEVVARVILTCLPDQSGLGLMIHGGSSLTLVC